MEGDFFVDEYTEIAMCVSELKKSLPFENFRERVDMGLVQQLYNFCGSENITELLIR